MFITEIVHLTNIKAGSKARDLEPWAIMLYGEAGKQKMSLWKYSSGQINPAFVTHTQMSWSTDEIIGEVGGTYTITRPQGSTRLNLLVEIVYALKEQKGLVQDKILEYVTLKYLKGRRSRIS